ncbi:MAG: sigma-70 family RNA polymerase sigma factor [Gammaproteobacteria bacterium]
MATPHEVPAPGETLDELLAATAQGDRRAFGRLYRLTSGRLFALALQILKRRELAEDVLQEAYLTVWSKAAQQHAGRASSFAWMATIVRHRAIDRLRARTKDPEPVADITLVSDSIVAEVADEREILAALSASVRQCLERLDQNRRGAILLAYYHGMTHEEIAAQLDTPLGTTKSWVRRGLLQLKGCLEQ